MEMTTEAKNALSEAVRLKHPVSNLEQVGVGQRMINILHENGIFDMEELMNSRREEIMRFPNFGEKQMEKLLAAISKYHLIED